ncbi:GNAT family N-acetyltransferase [Colwellia hornerae]|uniref:GNAT family N-acetyltransferase n=2 Tax=Colwellia hornerae TaxID=89402 RepID=A0A5C6Q356_9GAMM|nr:GNAT family N-acetyltransferase [Colwellia hornerae]TWX47191.1 GNAT family N-acetyltransferase [Colwellia hornerae]TWX54493.1 GNAT family N-acetyltransferase [Colwellia hornerae]TWX63273.1 GNAT family N-acetyltransferase [Colwellia hornerae]
MANELVIRRAQQSDHSFIFELSPVLADVAQLSWHSDDVIQKMQLDYISEMLADSLQPQVTVIAERNGVFLGFIHVRTHKDSISGEVCGTIPLLAVLPQSQGLGVGKNLIEFAEKWSKDLGCRLLHLEVFANNKKANGFYQTLGFKPETVQMIKPI